MNLQAYKFFKAMLAHSVQWNQSMVNTVLLNLLALSGLLFLHPSFAEAQLLSCRELFLHEYQVLYERIPDTGEMIIGDLKLKETETDHPLSSYIEIRGGNGEVGSVERKIFTASHEVRLHLEDSRLDQVGGKSVPPIVNPNQLPEFIPGKGIPTVILSTLVGLRNMKVGFGGLTELSSVVTNNMTGIKLLELPEIQKLVEPHYKDLPPGIQSIFFGKQDRATVQKIIEQNFFSTKSGRYFLGIVELTGHRPVEVDISAVSVDFTRSVFFTERERDVVENQSARYLEFIGRHTKSKKFDEISFPYVTFVVNIKLEPI